MPVPLTALFAAGLHQVRSSEADPVGNDRTLSLLARAAAGSVVVFELDEDRLLVNGLPVGGEAPGALMVRTALIEHDTSKLELPAGMGPAQWGAVAELFASAPGLFPSADHVRDALNASVPGATLVAHGRPTMSPELRAALFDLPNPSGGGPEASAGSRALSSSGADRAEFSTRLDPILGEASRAVDAKDWEAVSAIIIKLRELEQEMDTAARTIVARERRRVTPTDIVDTLVRLLPKPTTPPIVGRAIQSLGPEGANALIEALNGAPGRAERRAYIDALAVAPEAESGMLTALGSHRPGLVRDVAEAAGRRRFKEAVPSLAALLRHPDAEVRTAAYRALEEIATPDAMEALARRS